MKMITKSYHEFINIVFFLFFLINMEIMIAIGRSVQQFSHRLMKYVNSHITKTCTATSTSFNGCSELASCVQGRGPYS